jgi:hypothetical protein
MKLQFHRLFVERTKQLSLLDEENLTKSDLLDLAFNLRAPFYFNIGDSRYAYVAQKESGSYIYASLAKASHVTVEHGPEEDFEEEDIESWPHIPLIINTDSDPVTGQSIAIELNQAVFRHPHVQLNRLVQELVNKYVRQKGFEMAINPITEQGEFWESIEKYSGNIRALTFEFASPNLFKSEDSLNDELRVATEAFGMTNTSIKIENSEGELKVPKDNTFVQQGIKYITDGGGQYKIQATKRTITSQESIKTEEIDKLELEIAVKNKEQLKVFCDRLFLWLKR